MNGWIPLGLLIIVLLVLISLFFRFVPVGLWITAYFSGVKVGIGNLIGMRLRRVVPKMIINPMIKATKAGLVINTNELEAHYLAGGNVNMVIDALIAAQRANIDLEFEQAAAIDLAGEETIIARVGEGIVTTVGSAAKHSIVLENPDSISQTVLRKGLDSGTAFEILSIDIADVDVGRNIGAKLQADQAVADKKIAQAKAEERRAFAVAQEQEMLAEVQRMRAKVVEAESEVPLAIADAFRKGNLGIHDYYQLQNIQADTAMRESIAKDDKPAGDTVISE